MKTVFFLFLLSLNAHADPFSDGIHNGRESCGLQFQLMNPNDFAKKTDFPSFPFYSPLPPPMSTVLVTEADYYREGALECGQAASSLVKQPNATVACVMTSGPAWPRILGSVITAPNNAVASAKVVKACVADLGFVKQCLETWIACFNRN